MREHLPAQRARREAPQRPPAQQADPLTAHQSMLKRLASASRFFVDLSWGRTRKGTDALQVEPALLGTPSCCFISAVLLPPNNASSPFDLMIANHLESTPRLNAIPESCFSESDSEWHACKR